MLIGTERTVYHVSYLINSLSRAAPWWTVQVADKAVLSRFYSSLDDNSTTVIFARSWVML